MPIEKVVVIIPTYNEEAVIGDTIAALADVVNESMSCGKYLIDVLVFDSASNDDTQKVIINLQKKYSWLYLRTEMLKTGLGSAYWQAMNYALQYMGADIVIEFDADLSHQPKYILPMLDELRNCDVVLGSRYVKYGSIPDDWGWHRKFISIFGNQIARFFLTRKYKDFTSGFRITRKNVLQKVVHDKFISNHYAYKLQLLWLLHQNKAKIYEYPIDFIDRTKGKSKLPANSINDSLRVILLLRLYTIFHFFKFFR